MKKLCVFILIFAAISCTERKVPDVSDIKVELKVQRFEQDFFSIDTNYVDQALTQLDQKYPTFFKDFIYNILGLTPDFKSSVAIDNSVRSFIRSYRPLKDSADNIFAETSAIEKEIHKGLQFVHYYFPDYKLPKKVITFIGPIDSYGNILTTDALAVGLQMYMGSSYSLYQSGAGQALYPSYISRRFQKEYIPVNCMKTIIDDIFPDNYAGKPLIEQMVQAGKRLYLLDHIMPQTADTLKTGYTSAQLKGCYDNEQAIWSYFVQNDLLYVTDPSVIKDYMNDAPTTQAFGSNSPGFIGQFVGWQIVKKWMKKNEGVALPELIETSARQIFDQAKYKP